MPHIVVLARAESGTGDEAMFGTYDLAGEEGGQRWMRVGQMLD